ncbi:hypothetical protein EDB89DRAFT_1068915 [Lactarius sanguifluus]|nr:hypothetical protein EDB89DRAFT_1068915 [Lactarius sanguifluus]
MGAQSHYPVSLPIFTKPQRPLLSIVSPSVRPLSLLSDPLPVASFRTISQTSQIRNITQGRPKKRKILRDQDKSYRHSTTIDMLPDNVLLEVFDFCRRNHNYARRSVWDWHLLVHICRRWRQIIFESRHRLILQIFCTHSTPVRKNLGIWPAIPIVIDYTYTQWGVTHNDEDNVLAALEHPDRLFDLAIRTTGSHLGNLATVMQEPFPMLTKIHITLTGGNAPALPAEFWEDMHHVYRKSVYAAFPFRGQCFFYPPATSALSISPKYRRLATFHPRQWSHFWPHYPGSKPLSLDSNRLPAAPIEYAGHL